MVANQAINVQTVSIDTAVRADMDNSYIGFMFTQLAYRYLQLHFKQETWAQQNLKYDSKINSVM